MSKFVLFCQASPCLNCKDRAFKCHSNCERYKDFCVIRDADRQRRNEYCAEKDVTEGYRAANHLKMQRRTP